MRISNQEEIDAAVKREAPARYARKLAAQFFNERVSTIFDPQYQDRPWCAFFGDGYEDGSFMSRGVSEAQAIRFLIEEKQRAIASHIIEWDHP